MTRDTDPATTGNGSGPLGSGPAVKVYIDGSITWYKVDENGNPLAGATFQACRTLDRFGTDITDECVTVTDNSSPDASSTDGTFVLESLKLGTWTIQETAAPTGYTGDFDRIETVTLTLASPDYVITQAWVNRPPDEGCTPGFWQGGTGAPLWDGSPGAPDNDPHWTPANQNPFVHDTLFKGFFSPASSFPELTMYDLVSVGGGEFDERKAMRSLVAAYLNASHADVNYPRTTSELEAMWADAVSTGNFLELHTTLDAFNNLGCDID